MMELEGERMTSSSHGDGDVAASPAAAAAALTGGGGGASAAPPEAGKSEGGEDPGSSGRDGDGDGGGGDGDGDGRGRRRHVSWRPEDVEPKERAASSPLPSGTSSPLGGKEPTAVKSRPGTLDVSEQESPRGGHKQRTMPPSSSTPSSSSASHALSAHLSHMADPSVKSNPLGPGLWAVQSAPGSPPAAAAAAAAAASPRLEKSPTFQLRLADASKREFWENLPNTTKLYLCLSLLVAPLVIALVLLDLVQHQLACTCGTSVTVPQSSFGQCPPALRGPCTWQPQSTYVGLIVSTVLAHHVGFLFGGILFENSHALVANIILTCVLLATVLYFTINEGSRYASGEQQEGMAVVVLGSITASLQLVLVGMAPPTYKQMGWRTYSRCAGDVRVKDPDKMWRLYARVNVFTTILKLDFLLVLLVAMTSLTVWIDFKIFGVKRAWLLLCFFFFPFAGFLVNLGWLGACWASVRAERPTMAKWTALATPATALWTVSALAAVIVSFDGIIDDLTEMGVPDANLKAIARDGFVNLWWLSVLVALQVVARLLCGYRMWVILSTYSLPPKPVADEGNNGTATSPQLRQMMSMAAPQQQQHHHHQQQHHQQQQQQPHVHVHVHPHLLPLTRGAWIGKPSSANPRKKRFFQLSSDGTTLRWSWDKYVLMLYVDGVEEDEDRLELTLSMSAEPDLVLRFLDDAAFRVWSRGLRKVMRGLLMPEGIDDDSRWSAVDLLWHLRGTGTGTGTTPVSGGAADGDDNNNVKGTSQTELRMALEEVQGVASAGSKGGTGRLVSAFRKIGKTTRRMSVEDPTAMRVDLAKRKAMKNRGAVREAARRSDQDGASSSAADSMSLSSASPRESCVCRDPTGPCGCGARQAAPLDPAEGRGGGGGGGGGGAPSEQQQQQHPSAAGSPLSQLSPIHESTTMATKSLEELGTLDDSKAAMPRLRQFHSMQLESENQQVRQLYPAAQGGLGSGSGALETSGSGDCSSDKSGISEGRRSTPLAAAATATASARRLCVPVSLNSLDQAAPIAEQLGLAGRVDDVAVEDLQLGKFLGAGAEGVVFAAWYNETPVAVKKTTNVHEVQMQVLAGSHDNIVSARGVIVEQGELLLVMEYCPRGTLDTMIHHAMGGRKASSGWDPVKVVLPMVRNIARGLLHLHKRSMPILHRDLKPGNIFVGHGLVMKIGDFGMSRQVTNPEASGGAASGGVGGGGSRRPSQASAAFRRTFTTGVVGTSVYSAPEVIAADTDDEEVDAATMLKADVYSFGVTLWEILSRKRPFDGLDHFQIHSAWLYSPQDMVLPPVKIDPALDTQATRVMATLSELAADCTALLPRQRPTAAQIVARLKTALNGTDTAV